MESHIRRKCDLAIAYNHIGSLISQSKPGRFRNKLAKIFGEISKEILKHPSLPYSEKKIYNESLDVLDSVLPWSKDKAKSKRCRHPMTFVSFVSSVLVDIDNKEIDRYLVDLMEYFTRTGTNLSSCITAAENVFEKWEKICEKY